MPLLPLGYPHHWEGAVGHGDTQRGRPHSAPKLKGRNGFIGEEVTILAPSPSPFLPPTYCPCPEGGYYGSWDLLRGPLTCLWQLWRDQEVGGRVGGPPPKQAVRAPALGVEAVVGQPGLCQSPSRVRWDQGLQQGWEWEQRQQRCQSGAVQGGGTQLREAAPWEWLPA